MARCLSSTSKFTYISELESENKYCFDKSTYTIDTSFWISIPQYCRTMEYKSNAISSITYYYSKCVQIPNTPYSNRYRIYPFNWIPSSPRVIIDAETLELRVKHGVIKASESLGFLYCLVSPKVNWNISTYYHYFKPIGLFMVYSAVTSLFCIVRWLCYDYSISICISLLITTHFNQ